MQDMNKLLCEMLNRIPIGAFILDGEGTYIYCNDAYCNYFSRNREYFVGKKLSDFVRKGFLVDSVYDEIIKTRQPCQSIVAIEDVERKVYYSNYTQGTPYFDDNGNIEYIFYTQEPFSSIISRLQQCSKIKKVNVLSTNLKNNSIVSNIVAESAQMKGLLSMLDSTAKTSATILINGPSGSGKEVIAKYIHSKSIRNEKPLITLNCAAIPENLIESELFGYEKGAFTGAKLEGKPGLIESAHEGTLFLDEINSMSLSVQAKLLRVLETKQVTRLGGIKSKNIDFRLICATNESLSSLIKKGTFRSDLYYRLNVVSINIPPLSQRKEDIPPLVELYQQEFCEKYSIVKTFSPKVMEALINYSWPGNVRELRNMVERLIVTTDSSTFYVSDLPNNFFDSDSRQYNSDVISNDDKQKFISIFDTDPYDYMSDMDFSLKDQLEDYEKNLLTWASGRIPSTSKLSKLFKLDPSNIYRKLIKYGIKIPEHNR